MPPDLKTVEALAKLSRTSEGLELLTYLDSEAQAYKNLLVDAVVDIVPKLQGKAKAVQDLARLLRDAPVIADKMRQGKA